jgi:hypothetical protein
MEIRKDAPDNVFICHQGIERSRAAAQALQDEGYSASHIKGGTAKIKELTPKEIRNLIPKNAKVKIIYDEGSPTVEYDDLESATAILAQADVKWEQISTADLLCALYTLGIRLYDYL